jgi:hypothetical protein
VLELYTTKSKARLLSNSSQISPLHVADTIRWKPFEVIPIVSRWPSGCRTLSLNAVRGIPLLTTLERNAIRPTSDVQNGSILLFLSCYCVKRQPHGFSRVLRSYARSGRRGRQRARCGCSFTSPHFISREEPCVPRGLPKKHHTY